jgi:hypothetical protein
MPMRNVNLDTLKFWLVSNGPLAKEDLCHKARIKFFTMDKIVRGMRMPTELEQRAICEATGIPRDQLFPVVENKKQSA